MVARAGIIARMTTFDPNAAAAEGSGIFGLPHTPEEARVHVIPVPFDATTSYRKGAAKGPEAILRASRQVDLFDLMYGRVYEARIAMLPADPRIAAWNAEATELADPIIAVGGELGGSRELASSLARVNAIGAEVNAVVEQSVERVLAAKQKPVVLGGDHSVPFGAFVAAAKHRPGLGLLHFDAHADLRPAYEGFEWSHASIFHNAMTKIEDVARLVQVGIRDLCEEEFEMIRGSNGRIRTLFDTDWATAKLEHRDLRALIRATLDALPKSIWVTFDVDGLDPTLCPNTGTPVPGGLSWHEAMLWLEEIAKSGREIVGCDLNEVSPGEVSDEDSIDANVGARLLYRMIGMMGAEKR